MSAKEYGKLVKATTGFVGAYPKIVPVKVGDYLQLNEDGVLVQLGNVFNWPGWKEAVPVDSEPIAGSDTYFMHCRREKTAEAGAGIEAPMGLGAEATVNLSFESEGGFTLAYDAAMRHRVREVPAVQREIVRLAEAKQWDEKWIVVTETIEAQSATLLVAATKGAKVSLSANAELPGSLGAVQIANPKLGWSSSSWLGSGYSSVCSPGTPLFHCVKVKRDWLRRLRTEVLGPEELADGFVENDPFDEE